MTPDMKELPAELGALPSDQAFAASPSSPSVSPVPASVPSAVTDHSLTIGILNPWGALWTSTAFTTVAAADLYLRRYWKGILSEEELRKFKLCIVRVTVTPESEPFDFPASGMQLREDGLPAEAEGLQPGGVAETPAPKSIPDLDSKEVGR